MKTGVGYPQLSAVIECADAAHGLKGHIISVSHDFMKQLIFNLFLQIFFSIFLIFLRMEDVLVQEIWQRHLALVQIL